MVMKKCSQCGEEKDRELFYRKYSARDGLASCCKECKLAKNREWYHANSKKRIAQTNIWRDNNPGAVKRSQKKYYDSNSKKRIHNAAKWAAKNRGRVAKREADRRASKILATPVWANQKYISLWYDFAKIESDRTGRRVQVDHIIPLKGKLVCGLHCARNMQLLFIEDNSSKNNRYEP